MARDRVHRPIENHRRGSVLIDGLPAYMKGKVPDGLATQNQLDRRGLRRGVGQRPAGWLWYRSGPGGYRGGPHTWTLTALYVLAETRQKRPCSPKQLEVLKNARAQQSICDSCGLDAGENLRGGDCFDCRDRRQSG